MDKRVKRLFQDTALFTMSSFSSKILGFLMLPLYTGILTLEEYGTADMITNIVSLLIPILTLSICDATLRFALQKNINQQRVLSNSMLLIIIATAVMMIATPFVKAFNGMFVEYWGYLISLFIVISLQQSIANYIKGINKTKIFAVQGVLCTIVLIGCNLVFLLVCKWRLRGYLLSSIIANIVSVLFMCTAAKLWKDLFAFKIDKFLLKKMLLYSIPMLFTSVAWWINTSLDKYMLISYVDISANGLYAVAHKIPTIFMTMTTLFSQAWRLSVVADYEYGNKQTTADFCSSVHKKYALLCVYACATLVLFSQLLSGFLFQFEYFVAWTLVPPLMLASLFESLSGFAASIYAALKKTKFLFVSTALGVIINIISNYFLIRNFGIMGAPVATFLSFVFVWSVRIIILKRFIDLKINFATLCPTLIILIFGSMYYALNLPYKTFVQISCIATMVLINAKTNRELVTFVMNSFKKSKKQGENNE